MPDDIRALLIRADSEEAERACARALRIRPNDPELLHLAGVAAVQRGKYSRAQALMTRALKHNPAYGPAHQDMGNLYLRKSDYPKARAAYEAALDCGQCSATLLTNLGVVYCRQGETRQGVACFNRALSLDPTHGEALANLALSQQKQGLMDQALENYRLAIGYHPDDVIALSGLASLYGALGNTAEALEIYRRLATDLAPNDINILRHFLHFLRRTCEWEELARCERRAEQLCAELGKPPWFGEDPFDSLVTRADPYRSLETAREFGRQSVTRAGRPVAKPRAKKHGGRIRLGYIFADVGDGPGAQLTRGIFPLHDRERISVHMYSSRQDDGSEIRGEIITGCDEFIDVHGWGDRQVASRIAADEIDILVDLDGWTRENRLGAAVLRPCDIQITYLGFAGSSGAPFFDYVIADEVVLPPEYRDTTTEAPILMPGCYLATDQAPRTSAVRPERADCELPEGAFVFCCFSQPYKIDPVMFASWMTILRNLSDSVLWLWDGKGFARDSLRQAARQHGIDANRLVFADTMNKPDHLRRLEHADLALDTRICNGHTTTVDLLWAGVPVLTLTGTHWPSRVSTSALTAMGLQELCTSDLAGFEARAIELARDREQLARLRDRVASNRGTTALFDTPRFVRHLDAALEAIWARHRRDLPPAMLSFDGQGLPVFNA